MTPSISVIMPVYNAADYLSEAVESILDQTYSDFELLIIDDGSNDGSKDIINSFFDARIKLFYNEVNKGPAYSRNWGMEISKGKYIAFIDADDIALPHRLEKQVEFMENHSEVGACGAYAEYIGAQTGIWKYPVTNNEIKCRLLWGSALINSSAIIRRSVVTAKNIWQNEAFPVAEDYKLWVDIGQVSKLYNIPEVLLKYRLHENQLTVTANDLMGQKKSRIIFEQLKFSGIDLLESDFEIVSKFILYKFNFHITELNRLFEIYIEFMEKNNLSQEYAPAIINEQIRERLFEACYFSTVHCGIKAIQLYKSRFGFNKIGFAKKMKFYFKSIKK